jgi:acetylornithine deacetylase
MTASKEAVHEYIENNSEEMLSFLSELVAAESLPGEERPAQDVMISKFESFGLEPDVWDADADELREHPGFFETTPYQEYGYEDRPNVAATKEGVGDGRSLTLSGHVDVVTPEPLDAWTHDPWETEIDGNRMYGRGTFDMKGGIAAWVHAFEALEACGVELDGDVTLQTTIEEEAGGCGGVLSALERGYRPDAAIVAEPSGVPTIGIASAGVMYFTVTVHGKAAHTAHKFLGVDAVGKATKIYHALEQLHDERNERYEDYPPALNQYAEAEGSTTNLSITSFDAGTWTSTVPGKATMDFRVGWPPSTGEDREDVREEILDTIQAVVDDDEWLSEHPPEIEWFGWSTDPHEFDVDSAFADVVFDNAESVTGQAVDYRGGLGGNDERFYNRYYDIPTPSIGPKGGNGHGADEYVEIDSLVETAKVMAGVAMDWCGVADES